MSTRGWGRLVAASLPDAVMVADLAIVTGLTKTTIRGRIAEWVAAGLLAPLPGYGPHGALSYPTDRVRELAAVLPGPGNRTAGSARSEVVRRGWVTRLGDSI